jgi:hypothetical protein
LNQTLADEFLQAIKAPEVSEPKVFVFVRHGHSTWNQQSRIQVSRPHIAIHHAATACRGILLHMKKGLMLLTRHCLKHTLATIALSLHPDDSA